MTNSMDNTNLDVLILTEDFYPKVSGGAFIIWNVAEYLVGQGDNVTVVTPRNDETPSIETAEGIEIRRPFKGPSSDVHPNSKWAILWRILFVVFVIPYLIYLCLDRDFDLVYSTNHLVHPPAGIICALFRVPQVSHVGYSPSLRDDPSLVYPLIMLERVNFRIFMGDRIICQTPSLEQILSNKCKGKVKRVDGIVDKEAVKSVINSNDIPDYESKSNSRIQLIYVGRLVDIKNPTKLPELISNLSSDYSLLIVGDGPQKEAVESAIEEAKVGDRVEVLGRLPHQETLQLIHNSDMLVLPSDTESYGAVAFEALSLNTPVIASPVGVLPMVDHSDLSIAGIEDFAATIPEISVEESDGINSETLEEFAVDRFAENVRKQMLLECSYTQGIRIE